MTLDHFTAEQLYQMNELRRNAFEHYETALRHIQQAANAKVKLPHTNEKGKPVYVLCNNAMNDIVDHWDAIAQRWWYVCHDIDHARTEQIKQQYKIN